MDRYVFDIIYLDHDLDMDTQITLNDIEDQTVAYDQWLLKQERVLTGLDVANKVASLPSDRRPTVAVVHSWNPEGADRMVEVLRSNEIPVVRWSFRPSDLPVL